MSKQTIIPPTGDASFASGDPVYASVLSRFIALLIDRLILLVIYFLLAIPFGLVSVLGAFLLMPQAALFFGIAVPSFAMFIVFVEWFYFAGLESSARGATFGKRLMGLRVTDETGKGLSFNRASLRYFAKILSALPMLLGFIMAFFTRKTQALHDFIAETVVIKS